jgi:DNA-binding transcriptional ArsR family regulator
MTPTRTFPYGGVPVYNPQSLSKPEAIAQFHARQDVYKRLLGLLREERPSHVLIIGTRGMGKTTLLQRVHYGVEDDNALNERFVVLEFPEEQYNVNRLHHFLLNTVDALADAMEKAGDQRMLTRVEAFADKTGKLTPQEIEEQVPKFLAEIGKDMSKSFLLLVDNADRLFDTIQEREQWQLRELLSNREDLTLFGATTQASEGIYGPKRAFFEFFKIETLTPLSVDEVRNLLLQLSESVEESEKGAAKRRVQDWLDADPGRLRTLVQLTGGNPRTTVLLFHLVLDGLSGGAREYLEQLLDQCTPNYKGRIDELPAQAQQILDAVALRWDPVTAMDIATDTKLETSAVSTQLTRLVRQGLLEKADPGESKKALYQVAERFFNIWYLIRASRRVRAKLRWFVEFLRVFFDSKELERKAWEHVGKFRNSPRPHSEIENAFAYFLAAGAERTSLEEYLIKECPDLEHQWRPFLDLVPPEEPASSVENAEKYIKNLIKIDPVAAQAWFLLGVIILASNRMKEKDSPSTTKGALPRESERALSKARSLDPKVLVSTALWSELSALGRRYPFLRELLTSLFSICQLDDFKETGELLYAAALAQLGSFPRATVAMEDALTGDAIKLLDIGRPAIEVFFAAAVRNNRTRDCIDLLDKKDWKDAWRPIYEALKAVEAGSGDYLKRVAVEIRQPAAIFLRRIAPNLPNIPE